MNGHSSGLSLINTVACAFLFHATLTPAASGQLISEWQGTAKNAEDQFGDAVALEGGIALIGAPAGIGIGEEFVETAAYSIDVSTGETLAVLSADRVSTLGMALGGRSLSMQDAR